MADGDGDGHDDDEDDDDVDDDDLIKCYDKQWAYLEHKFGIFRSVIRIKQVTFEKPKTWEK